jgi:hypothetical protein
MKELKLIRKNIVANEATKFEFDVEGFEFLVKNFTNGDIYVAYENTTDTDEMSKIPSMAGQVCIINKDSNLSDTNRLLFASKDIYVYSTSVGEVEVQCLKF